MKQFLPQIVIVALSMVSIGATQALASTSGGSSFQSKSHEREFVFRNGEDPLNVVSCNVDVSSPSVALIQKGVSVWDNTQLAFVPDPQRMLFQTLAIQNAAYVDIYVVPNFDSTDTESTMPHFETQELIYTIRLMETGSDGQKITTEFNHTANNDFDLAIQIKGGYTLHYSKGVDGSSAFVRIEKPGDVIKSASVEASLGSILTPKDVVANWSPTDNTWTQNVRFYCTI